MRKKIIGQALAVCLALGLFTMEAPAQVFRIAPQQSAKIDKHGVCRIVKNTNGTAAMVPAKSAAEWASGQSSFLAREREGLIVSACECSPLGRTYGDVQYINNLYKPVISASGDDIAGIYEVNGSARLQFYSKSGSNYATGQSFSLANKPYGDVVSMAFSRDGTKLLVVLVGGKTMTYAKSGSTWSLSKSGSVVSSTIIINNTGAARIAASSDGAVIAAFAPKSSNAMAISILSLRANGNWVETGRIVDADVPGALHPVFSDFEMSDSGDKILVEYADNAGSQGKKIGAALFEYQGGNWKLTKNLVSSENGSWTSYFLTQDGNRIIASLQGSIMSKGFLRAFEKRSGQWKRVHNTEYPKTSGLWDKSGIGVWQVSGDGSFLLEGLPGMTDIWTDESSRRFHYFDGNGTKLMKPGTLDPGGKKWLQGILGDTRSEVPRLSSNGEVTIFKTVGNYVTINGELRGDGPTVALGMVNCAD